MTNQSTIKTPEGTCNREVMGGLIVGRGNPSGAFVFTSNCIEKYG
jgi:hypothetical protein